MQTLIGFVTFIALLAVGLLGLQAGGQVAQAIIGLLSAGVGFAVWRAQENAKNARELESKLGSDKKVLYKLYLDVLRDVVETDGKVNAAATVKQLRRWVFASLLIASDEVVLAFNRFLGAARVGENMAVPAIADVILAMRLDAGDADSTLEPIDILQTFIKNEEIDDMRPLCEMLKRERHKAWRLPPARFATARR